MSKKKLGRGLQALLGMDDELDPTADVSGEVGAAAEDVDAATIGPTVEAPLALLDANPYQPRKDYNTEDLAELTASIRAHGVIQPVIVRAVGERYQIIAGERRCRAASDAGLASVPVRVVAVDDQQTFEFALVENLQRRDLNALEKAQAFQEYIGKFGATHEELAAHLGVDRSTVSNFIRLLELPDAVRDALRVGQITFGHARALLALDDAMEQIALCRRIVSESLSVREIERQVKERRYEPAAPVSADRSPGEKPAKSHHLVSMESDLRQRFGARVEIKPKAKDKGSITIHFDSHEDFERVMEQLMGRAVAAF